MKRREELAHHPFVEDVRVQAIAIGELKLLGLPGEVLCSIGLKLQSGCPGTWALGFANGTVGYIPTRTAFRRPGDYACYCAPCFLALFPFKEAIEGRVLRCSNRLLRALGCSATPVVTLPTEIEAM